MTNKIIEIISGVLGVEIDADASQTTCEKWDSLQHLNIIVALEEEFDLSFEPEEIAEMKSVAIIEEFIVKYQDTPNK